MFDLSRLKKTSTSVKATLAFGIASFAVSGINYVTTPIFTRILSTSDYGLISVYNSWYEIIRVLATMTLIFPGILQVGLHEHSENRWKYLSSMLGVITGATGLLAVLYFFFHNSVQSFITLDPSLIALMLLVCVFQSATTLWTTKQRYEYNYKITILVTIGSAIIAQIVAIAAVLIMCKNPTINLAKVRLWSSGLVNIIVGLILFVYILSKGRAFVNFPLWKTTFIVAVPLVPHYLSSVILHSTDRIMISQLVGADKAGIYSIAVTLSSIGVLFWRALSTTFSPFINTKLSERKYADINRSVLPLLTIVGLTCILGALAAPEIIKILATNDYLSGIYVVPPVVIGIFLHALYDVFSAVAFFHKKSTQIMIASIVAAASNIVLNYFCISQFGFVAAGYTTMVSNMILTSMHYFNMRRIEPEKIYDSKLILLSIIVVSCSCLICNLLYQANSIIRYILIIIVVGIILSQRKSVINAISNMKV